MSFLNPLYLWSLLGLLIPIAIHFWSKKEGKTIKVGSIELLRESESKQTSSIKLNEFWLLLLRLFIITLVVFIMAEPHLNQKLDTNAKTYLIEPNLLLDNTYNTIVNTIDSDSDIRLLTTKFPFIDEIDIENYSNIKDDYWHLMNEMESLNSDSIIVYSNSSINNFNGLRSISSKNIEWINVSKERITNKELIQATQIDNNIELLNVSSDIEYTKFEKSVVESLNQENIKVSITENKPIAVLLKYTDEFENDARYLEASLSAVSKHINRTINISKQTNNNSDSKDYYLIIKLDNTNEPSESDNILITYRNDEFSQSIIEKGVNKNHFYLTRRLNPENIISKRLPEEILRVLDLNSSLNSVIRLNDKRALSKAEIIPIKTIKESIKNKTKHKSITKWLWLLLGTSLIGERIISAYRKQ